MSSKQEQVEARTLSGVHLGMTISFRDGRTLVVGEIEHTRAGVLVYPERGAGAWLNLGPSDLVTLTDGGAS